MISRRAFRCFYKELFMIEIEYRRINEHKIQWFTIAAVVFYHVMAIGAFFTFSWQNLIVALVSWWIIQSFGVGIGYHRLLTHKGFKVAKWLEYTLTFLGTLGMQAGAITWVTTHRLHHSFTDSDTDPHSATKGIWWSHIGWIFKGAAQQNDEATHRKYSPDLMKDKVHVFMNKYYTVPTVVLAIIFFAIGGMPLVFWGIFLRTVWAWHCTWTVNSLTHAFGSRRFETGEDSRNNAFVALLTWGEGWHNNHHANAVSARHGLTWWEFDINWITLKVMEAMGLVSQIKEHSIEQTITKTLRNAA
jgi:sn-1 stearoyl-lipid 9-desaturase